MRVWPISFSHPQVLWNWRCLALQGCSLDLNTGHYSCVLPCKKSSLPSAYACTHIEIAKFAPEEVPQNALLIDALLVFGSLGTLKHSCSKAGNATPTATWQRGCFFKDTATLSSLVWATIHVHACIWWRMEGMNLIQSNAYVHAQANISMHTSYWGTPSTWFGL